MSTAQKWLMGLIGLGALYLVVTNPTGFYKAATGVQRLVGGTETQIITGGKRGG
jgi:precorrin isomerase